VQTGNVWRPNIIKHCLVTKHADVEVSGQTVVMFDQTPYQTPPAKNYGPQINPRNFLSARFQYGGTDGSCSIVMRIDTFDNTGPSLFVSLSRNNYFSKQTTPLKTKCSRSSHKFSYVFSLCNTEVLQDVGSWFWGTRKQVDNHLFQGNKAYFFEFFGIIFKVKKNCFVASFSGSALPLHACVYRARCAILT